MKKTLYVIGHRNPDTDSIASAIAYAELKKRLGAANVIAAMAGEPNPQTRYILDRLGIAPPLFLADVHPKVQDVVNRRPITLGIESSSYEALESFQASNVRVLPLLDAAGKPCALLTLLRLSESYLLPCTDRQREIRSSLPMLARTLSGKFVAGGEQSGVNSFNLFIGAMLEASFSGRIAAYEPRSLIVMTGDRRSIQKAAIDRGVGLLVITGGLGLESELRYLAEKNGVSVLLTPHDTATAAWLARLSSPVSLFADRSFATIGIGEPLAHLRQKLVASGESALLVVEEDGTLAGVATKSSLLAPIPYALILVDHNELGQAVPGAESVEILEVIDHHKLGNSPSITPITFITSPVGSTCTLIAARYREALIEPEKKIAALLLAGILSDTVILKSPTTTEADRQTAQWLAVVSAMNLLEFGSEIFASCSSLKQYGAPARVVDADFKIFSHGERKIGVGQVEVVGFGEFERMKTDLLDCLAKVKQRDNLFIAGLMVTDIVSGTTRFLVEGHTRIAHVMEYPQLEPHLYELKDVMSRKKQMVPHLLKILDLLK